LDRLIPWLLYGLWVGAIPTIELWGDYFT